MIEDQVAVGILVIISVVVGFLIGRFDDVIEVCNEIYKSW
jgi:hypothetical protein